MGKVCLKCGYERNEEDDAPSYSCPKCSAVYAKVEAYVRRQKGGVAKQQSTPGSKRILDNPLIVHSSFVLAYITLIALSKLIGYTVSLLFFVVFLAQWSYLGYGIDRKLKATRLAEGKTEDFESSMQELRSQANASQSSCPSVPQARRTAPITGQRYHLSSYPSGNAATPATNMNVERYRHTQMRTPNVVSRENGLRVHESVSTPAGNKCSELQRHIESLKIRYNSAESTERPEISRRIEELEESRDNCLEELAAARRKERIQDTHAAPSDNGAQPIAWGKTERVREAQAIDAAPEGSLSIVFDRAISFYEDRDIDNALQQLEQAERSAVSTEDKITIIQAYHTIANDLTSLPNALPLAEKLLRKCLAYNDVSGLASPDVASVTYGLLFSVLIGEENYSGLQQEANALLSLVPSISNDPKFSEANAYLHLGMAHEHGGNRSKADEVFEQSRKAANQSRNEELIQSVAGYIERTHRRRANSRSAASASLRSRSSIVAAEDIPSLLSRASITGDQYPAVGARPSLQKTTSALVVIDAATNLMWQTECSSSGLGFFQARDEYVSSLNARRYAGHSDWRLPTLEEAASLVFARGRDFYFALPDEFWTCDRDAHDPKVPERHPGVGGFFKLMFVSGEDNQGSLWIMSNRGRCHTTWWSEHAPFAVACRNV